MLAALQQHQHEGGGVARFAPRWGRAADALAHAACSRPRAKLVGVQWRSQVHPVDVGGGTDRQGGAAVLASLGSGSGSGSVC